MSKEIENNKPVHAGRDKDGKFTEGNLWAYMKKRTGRPCNYATGEELLAKGLEYFEWATQTQKGKFALADLRVFCEVFSKTTWKSYKSKPDFMTPIHILEGILEGYYEKKMQWAGSYPGAYAWLKNKAGYTDESTQNQNLTNLTANFGTRDEKTK